MGYMIVLGNCFTCQRRIAYNPNHVPSIRQLDNGESTRHAICHDCATAINANRVEAGMEPIPIHPEAYEPVEHP